jgi:hypothetical protein
MNTNPQICRFSNLKTITKVFFVTFILQSVTQQMFGQFADDFSDSNFTDSPAWSGTESKFTVDDESLKLQTDPVSGSAFLSLPSAAINNTSWEFLVSFLFNPSSSNFARVYLTSDYSDLTESLHGYYVMIGNTTDDVSLYKQNGTTHTILIDGQDGSLDAPSSTTKIRVTRDSLGIWHLFTDIGDVGAFYHEGTVQDNSFESSHFFGISCTFTATRSDKFYFDDFLVTGESQKDLSPPEIEGVETLSSTSLALTYSEPVDRSPAESTQNYFVNNGIGNPDFCVLQDNNTTIILKFANSFPPGVMNTITLSSIADIHGNAMDMKEIMFVFIPSVVSSPKDVIITEIFADPTPVVALPQVEYVELYNRSTTTIDLEGWQMSDGNSAMTLPPLILLPAEYLILANASTELTTYGKVWGAPDFPALNNGGDFIILKDAAGKTIDSLYFDERWYGDNEKKAGGWSLEIIDPNNDCSDQQNWTASEDLAGGTPGQQNSVFANKPDLTAPILISAVPLSDTTIRLTFNERLEETLPAVTSLRLDPAINVIGVAFGNKALTEIILSLEKNIQAGIAYTIVTGSIYDCSGNQIRDDSNTRVFGLPEDAAEGDLIVNEILFNPNPTGVDFVEIANTSSKFINLKGLFLSNFESGVATNIHQMTAVDILLQPSALVVFTEDVNVLKGEYLHAVEENIIQVPLLPRFNDDAGSVAIGYNAMDILDYFIYSDELHSVFLREPEGVSLERIDFRQPTLDIGNWKSASSLAGFATPGYQNSNATPHLTPNDASVSVDPIVFDPLTGSPTFTQIHFSFPQGGNIANVKVYDDQGHVIKQIANNEVLGTQGAFRWDGDQDDGTKARVGYYMVWLEVFDPTGSVKIYRKPVAIATPF